MKSADEIKKGLECCSKSTCEPCCPYGNAENCNFAIYLLEDVLAYIRQLEAERAAAVTDMRQASIYLCCACKKYHHAVRGVSHHYCEVIGEREDFTGAISCGMFEWRGVQKEETNEEDPHTL